MRYSRISPDDPHTIERVKLHVFQHLSSVYSETDDPFEFIKDVELSVEPASRGSVLITGSINHPNPSPAYSALDPLAIQIQRELTERRVPWRIISGAQTRGNGQSWGKLEGVIMHHTATKKGPAPSILWVGRSDLRGPLCNTAGEPDGTIAFVAYHPANHAGASGGKSMGPLPITNLFNRRVWGHEIVYEGTAPMTDAQYRSAVILGAVIADVIGRNQECVRAHAETSITGKWDPGYANGKTINMQQFRSEVAAAMKGDAAMATELDYLEHIYTQIAGHGSALGEFKGWPSWKGGTSESLTIVDYLRRNNVEVRQLHENLKAIHAKLDALTVVGNNDGADDETLARLIAETVLPVITEAVQEALGKDNEDIADRILNALKERL